MFLISPDGAARDLCLQSLEIFQHLENSGLPEYQQLKVHHFDWRNYRHGYSKLLAPTPDSEGDPDLVADMGSQTLLCKLIENEITHILIPALVPISAYFLRLFQKCGIHTAHWFFEDFRSVPYWKDVGAEYQDFFAIQQGELERALKGNTRFHFLPNAALSIPPGAQTLQEQRPFDLCFIGVPSPHRIQYLETLVSRIPEINLCIAGENWKHYNGPLQSYIVQDTWVTPERAQQLWCQSKCGLNMGTQPTTQPEHSQNQVSPRAFDILSCGAELLCENSALNAASLDGLRYHSFSTPDQLAQLCYNLQTKPESNFFWNQNLILKKHLWLHRLQTVLQIMETPL
jgi:spore maturation protein CgeB